MDVRRGMVGGQEAPEQFLWRERLYVVREVLAHWAQTGAWWRSAAVRPVYGLEAAEAAGSDTGIGDTGGDGRSSAPAAVLDDPGREVWRVSAAQGRRGEPTVVDLALDEGSGSWLLLRVHD